MTPMIRIFLALLIVSVALIPVGFFSCAAYGFLWEDKKFIERTFAVGIIVVLATLWLTLATAMFGQCWVEIAGKENVPQWAVTMFTEPDYAKNN